MYQFIRMEEIINYALHKDEVGVWWLGQAGYIFRSNDITIVIDPYLSDSAAIGAPEFSRLYPVPISPSMLQVDVFLITHDHLDHLDPETIRQYRYKNTTKFVAPHLAAKKLVHIGIPIEQINVLHVGEDYKFKGVCISAVFTIPGGVDVLDTIGYFIEFENGLTVYHTSDTQFHPLLLEAAPKNPNLMLVPINGKWGNLNVEEAVQFTKAIRPQFVHPNHYDLMALNSENPATFEWHCRKQNDGPEPLIIGRMKPYILR